MKKIKKTLKIAGGAIAIVLIVTFFRPTWTAKIEGANSISVLEQVEINGSAQEIMIRGRDRNNPVLLFVHGGPGTPEIPYAADYQDRLEERFTVVNYDQRGSGKSHHFFEKDRGVTSDILVEDLLAVTDYVSQRLGQQKVILAGHSYGTYIATQAAAKAPDKFEAYIGIGQMSDTVQSEIDSLEYTLSQARQAGNTEDIAYLEGRADRIRSGDTFTPRQYVAKYGGAARQMDSPDGNLAKLVFSSEYNLLDAVRYYYGVNASQEVLLPEVMEQPLTKKVTRLELPVYFIMGKYDYMTSSSAAKTYFDTLQADRKEFVVFEESAHYPQFEEKNKFCEWMAGTFLQNVQ